MSNGSKFCVVESCFRQQEIHSIGIFVISPLTDFDETKVTKRTQRVGKIGFIISFGTDEGTMNKILNYSGDCDGCCIFGRVV
jgi:hypothetical protein